MNRSLRSSDPAQQGRRTLASTIMKEKGEEAEDLALFLEMRKHEKERNLLHHDDNDNHLLLLDHHPPGSKPGSSPLFKIVSSSVHQPQPTRRAGIDDFLNSESDKNDYDWLLTPPGTPLFPSLDNDSNNSSPSGGHATATATAAATPKSRQTLLKSRLANPADTSSRNMITSRHAASSSGLNSSGVGACRPSSSGGRSTSSRPATPTGRSTLPASSKLLRPSTPTSRVIAPSKPVAPPPRSSTPTRSSIASARSSTTTSARPSTIVSSRPSTTVSTRPSATASTRPSLTASTRPCATASTRPSATASARSSTPSSRPVVSAPSKNTSRPATPTRRSTIPSSLPASSAPPGRSSSVTKSAPTTSKISAPVRGPSPTVRSRPWKPSDMPGYSLDAPPNLRTSMPDRPSSASRGRPGAPSSRSSSVDTAPGVRPRRQSCSPSRGRAPNGSIHSGGSVPAVNRSRVNSNDSVSPVMIGSKMVERVVSLRRLVPPKQDDQRSSNNSLTGKSSSPDSTGFGRTLSKKSLDMAMRHMDIRRSIPNSLRPLMTNIPASSMYSVRSGCTRSRAVSVSDSPLATSSNASSELSVSYNNIPCLDGSEMEDDVSSERGGRFSADPLAR